MADSTENLPEMSVLGSMLSSKFLRDFFQLYPILPFSLIHSPLTTFLQTLVPNAKGKRRAEGYPSLHSSSPQLLIFYHIKTPKTIVGREYILGQI